MTLFLPVTPRNSSLFYQIFCYSSPYGTKYIDSYALFLSIVLNIRIIFDAKP